MKQTKTTRVFKHQQIAVINLSFFGGVWLIYPLINTAGVLFYVSLALMSLAIAGIMYGTIMLVKKPGADIAPDEMAVKMQRFNKIVGWQWLAISALIIILVLLRLPQLIAFGVMMAVGLHFIPLARIFATSSYYVAAAILIIIAIGGAIFQLLHPEMTAPHPLPFVATSVVLLVTAAAQYRN